MIWTDLDSNQKKTLNPDSKIWTILSTEFFPCTIGHRVEKHREEKQEEEREQKKEKGEREKEGEEEKEGNEKKKGYKNIFDIALMHRHVNQKRNKAKYFA